MIIKTKRSQKWIEKLKAHKHTGTHLIAEFWEGQVIENPKKFKQILVGAVKKSKSTVLKVVVHKFSPKGITGVVVLAESHLAIHTWPELNYVAVDIFTCGDKSNPQKALVYLKKEFKPKRIEIKELRRGIVK
jgi:S-adenosylmethionine decarboxylase